MERDYLHPYLFLSCSFVIHVTVYLLFQFNNELSMNFSCKEPVEPLTLDEIADRCHCPDEVLFPC